MDYTRILRIKRTALIAILSVFFACVTCKTFAIQAEGTSEKAKTEEKAFNPGEAILEHIADSHSWTIWGHTAINLPIIIFTDRGRENFSSAVFNHGESAYHGKYYNYKLVDDKIKVVNAEGEVDKAASHRIYDFSITKNVIALWLSVLLLMPVELIGVISRPFALMIRLYANISAGHIIVLSLISMIFIFKSLAFAPVSIAFVLFMDVLELLVAFLQAFIFTILTALFIGTAIEEHHH
ncbi:MAG: hypothetical protein EOP42_13410 [Sphingobacteriaceae bacterium]|nr:MAG: hypothetical protein EOP42_13410 [Sphingobacteriaceae bacterium]